MKIININENITKTFNRLNAEAGGEAECAIELDGQGSPYLRTLSWSGSEIEGMVTVCEYDADRAAETLGLDDDSAFAWCTGEDGQPTLAEFDSVAARDQWLAQK